MRVAPQVVRTLLANELRMVLRDRRTIVTSIVLPLVFMPLMMLGSHWVNSRRQAKVAATTYRYAVTGSEAAAATRLADATRARLETATPAGDEPPLRLQPVAVADPSTALRDRRIDLYLEGTSAAEARARARPPTPRTGSDEAQRAEERAATEDPVDGAPVIAIVFRGDRDLSATAARRLRNALVETRRDQQGRVLIERGFALAPSAVAPVEVANLASDAQVAGLTLGRLMTVLLLMFMMAGAAVVATDSLAGEKERGTLETLLTSAATRVEIVVAKLLLILSVAVTVTVIQVLNFLVYVGLEIIPAPAALAAAVPPRVALLLLVLYLPLAALVASVLLMTSGRAATYKEAQLQFMPVFLLALLPAASPFLPGLPLRSAIVLLPVANIALAVKEILVGSFDWPMIAISWLVTAGAAALVTRAAVRSLSAERLISTSESDAVDVQGGPALFERQVLRWFALVWAALLVVSGYTGTADLRVQLFVNLVVLFLGASLIMMWRYRLDPRETLALRAPRPAVWVAVAAGVPAGLITGIGVFSLASLLFPIPRSVLESFSTALLNDEMSTLQVLFFLCLMPGVLEEIAFRGVLLHGLRRRFHPVVVALVVGGVFGLMHVSLFRLAPTAWLGIILAAVTLLTGSIYPAMVWHAANNALALLSSRYGFALAELEAGTYVAAAAILAASFWIIWRNRTPYPGIRPFLSARR